MLNHKLINDNLYSWLGYGNIDGYYWFIGVEEGGAEIWRNETKTLEESLKIRSNFELEMDFRYVWEQLYGIPLEEFKGACVWNYMAAFLLGSDDVIPNRDNVCNYVFEEKKLGSKNSNHFMCELLPLPKPKRDNIFPYKGVWSSNDEYYNDIIEKRFEIIRKAIIDNKDVEWIVSYDWRATKIIVDNLNTEKIDQWTFGKQKYSIYEVRITEGRNTKLLSTQFFGNGQISYEGIFYAAQRIKGSVSVKSEFISKSRSEDVCSKDRKLHNVEKNTQKSINNDDVVGLIESILGEKFKPKHLQKGITYWNNKNRILKIVISKRNFKVEFNVNVSLLDGVTYYNQEERVAKHLGTCMYIYEGNSLDTVLELVKEARNNYEGEDTYN